MKIFINTSSLLENEKLIPLLYPLLGLPNWDLYHDSKFNKNIFNDYSNGGISNFELSSLEECDCIVFPYDYSQVIHNDRYTAEVHYYSAVNAEIKKLILIFWSQDFEFKTISLKHFKHYYLFHSSFYKSQVNHNVSVYPYFVNDSFVEYQKKESSRTNNLIPSISFCGFAPPLGITISKYYFKEWFKFLSYRLHIDRLIGINIKQAVRVYSIRSLRKSKKINTRFLIRKWSGFDSKQGMFIGNNDAYYNRMRKEYFKNIDSGDYVLCARGNGNFSIRFYEALCHKKIPVVINTDMMLPFENYINWQEQAVIVNENEIKNIEQKILNYHSENSNCLEDIKENNRRIWEEYFTPKGFFLKIEMLFPKQKAILN